MKHPEQLKTVEKLFQKPIDKYPNLCYNIDNERRKELNKMTRLFIVDTDNFFDYAEFETYREAEIYCGERGISTDCIFEEEE